jgi:hypothetical protein
MKRVRFIRDGVSVRFLSRAPRGDFSRTLYRVAQLKSSASKARQGSDARSPVMSSPEN